MKQSDGFSTWFEDKEAEVATSPQRGRKRAPVDKKRRELAQKVLLVAHDRLRTWEAVANFYGLSKAAAYRIAKDNTYRPSKAMLNAIIETGLPMARRVWIDPCPDCGSVHHARCNGHEGAVVVLAPGERIVTPRGPWQSKAKPEVAAMVAGLEACLARKVAGPVPGVEGGV